jgi:hypothetical protein
MRFSLHFIEAATTACLNRQAIDLYQGRQETGLGIAGVTGERTQKPGVRSQDHALNDRLRDPAAINRERCSRSRDLHALPQGNTRLWLGNPEIGTPI